MNSRRGSNTSLGPPVEPRSGRNMVNQPMEDLIQKRTKSSALEQPKHQGMAFEPPSKTQTPAVRLDNLIQVKSPYLLSYQ